MQYGDGRFKSQDNLNLYRQWWRPDSEPKAIVIFVHGSLEHSGRYADAASKLVEHGYGIHAYDLRSHGKSEGEPLYIPCFDALIQDLNTFISLLRQDYPDKPIFLLGHSVGCIIILAFILQNKPSDIKGIIFNAPILKMSTGVSSWVRIFAPLIMHLFPRLRLKAIDTRLISTDPKAIAGYENDLLIEKKGLFACTAADFLRTLNNVLPRLEEITTPLLILHGTLDRIADIEGSEELYKRASSSDKTFKKYELLYHDLFHEVKKERIFSDIAAWLDERL